MVMAWEGSRRKASLPGDWHRIRLHILERDGKRCQWMVYTDGHRSICGLPATDVDHIRRGNDHSDENLRSLCSEHHKYKSSGEGAAAYNAKRRAVKSSFRRREEHPGRIS